MKYATNSLVSLLAVLLPSSSSAALAQQLRGAAATTISNNQYQVVSGTPVANSQRTAFTDPDPGKQRYGWPIDYCMDNSFTVCGEAVASRYCQDGGYDRAISYHVVKQQPEKTVFVAGGYNNQALTDHFSDITCSPHDAGQDMVFDNPWVIRGHLDHCSDTTYTICGEPVATKYCKSIGYSTATSWEVAKQIPRASCHIDGGCNNADAADFFTRITCSHH